MSDQPATIIRVPPSNCPECGKTTLAVSGSWRTPQPGDANICNGCGCLLIFDAQLHVRRPTAEEAAEVAADGTMMAGVRRIRQVLSYAWQAQAHERN